MAARTRNRFYADRNGIQRLLLSDMVAGALVAHAKTIEETAREIAPKRSGSYARSFYTDVRVGGSQRTKRVVAVVGNNDPAAYQIEVGTSDTPAHRTLRIASGAKKRRGKYVPDAS